MIGPWDRIEGSSHDDDLDSGVEARIADPLWMLARQWQVGELRGDDAGSPVVTRLAWSTVALASYQAGRDGPTEPVPSTGPLERTVEAAPPPEHGAAAASWASRLAMRLGRRLTRQGLADAVDLLRAGFPLPIDATAVAMAGPGTTAIALEYRRGFDAAAILDDPDRTARALGQLPSDRLTQALAVIDGWRNDVRARIGIPEYDAWQPHRLEYRFSLTTDAVVLTADGYDGTNLDWYSFDVDPHASTTAVTSTTQTASAIPTPVRYSGMPAPRWWAFEDGNVHFGDIAADPGDIGRLLLADYATVYGNDWHSVPLRLPIGTLTRIDGLRVFDTMGRHVDVPPAAVLDDRKPGGRAFRLYELTGDPSVGSGLAPLLLLPPTVSGSEVGPALDRVEFVRDEAANLVWAVERLVEGPVGAPLDRLQQWRTTTKAAAAGTGTGTQQWRYRLAALAPPYWIPFVPTRIGDSAQVRLGRARMREWEFLDRSLVGAQSDLLQPDGPMTLDEEEVPTGGVTVERRWRAARWTDGTLHVWQQRRKSPGSTERSSGLRWDILDEPPDPSRGS